MEPPPSVPRRMRYHLLGREYSANNAVQAFVHIFQMLAERDASLLERLEPQLRGPKNRQLGRSVAELSANPAMRKSAVSLPGGWWFLTRRSNRNKISILKTACDAAGVPFGRPDGLQIDLPNS